MDERQRKEKELELLELEEQEANAGNSAPLDPSKDSLEFERSDQYPHQGITTLAPSIDVAMAPMMVRDTVNLAKEVPTAIKAAPEMASGIRNYLAEKLGGLARNERVRALGLSKPQVAELMGKDFTGEKARELGDWANKKGLLPSGARSEDILKLTEVPEKTAGAGIGALRDEATAAGKPNIDALVEGAQDRLSYQHKYGPDTDPAGLKSGLEDLTFAEPSYRGIADVATNLNASADRAKGMMRPSSGSTDVADYLANKVDEGINALGPAKSEEYAGLKSDWGNFQNIQKALRPAAAGDITGRGTLPMSKLGLMGRAQNAIMPPTRGAALADTVANILRTDPSKLGKYAEVLGQALQRGKTGLASTMFVLQQQDQGFQDVVKELNGDER